MAMAGSPIRARCFYGGMDNDIMARWPRRWWNDLKGRIQEGPVPAEVEIYPRRAQACEAHSWKITYRPTQYPLKRGAHVAIEVPTTWKPHLGNPFPLSHKGLRLPGGRSGYGSFVTVASSNPDVEMDVAISYSPYMYLIDVAIVKGALGVGDALEVVLGAPESSVFQAQKHAQRAIIYVAVDLRGDGGYRNVRKHPEVEVIGGPPTSFKIVAPASIEVGVPFDVKIIAVDAYNENPASLYRGTAEIGAFPPGLSVPKSVEFRTPEASTENMRDCIIKLSARAEGRGTFYITAADPENGIFGRSNPMSTELGGEGKRLYFGEIHAHNELSLGCGDMDEYFLWGRDAECLDFCSTGIHTAGNYRVGDTELIWNRIVEHSNKYNDPGEFVTLLGYEWSGGGRGDKNVYYRSGSAATFPGNTPQTDTPEKLWARLDEQGQPALTIPHHVKYGGITDWGCRNDRYQRLTEMCSVWGISETGGEHCVQKALAMGHRLGFTGGTDNHFGQPGHGPLDVNTGKGLVAVYADALTREAVFDALYGRYCYATTGARILLDFRVDGYRMGSEIPVSGRVGEARIPPRKIYVGAAGTSKIDRIEIVRNNEVIHAMECNNPTTQIEWEDGEDMKALPPTFPDDAPFAFYYVRLIQVDREMAWSSPIWFNFER